MPRPIAHLANLDLNLLVALRELLRERSVTRAAERLGVTQPAASAALSRLRRHFGDELLVRDRGEYTLTPLGAQLAEQADVADRSGYTGVIERAGGRLLGDSCPAMSRVAPEGTRVFATDSAKQAHYLPAILGIEAWFGTLEDCVDAAVTGQWHGRLT